MRRYGKVAGHPDVREVGRLPLTNRLLKTVEPVPWISLVPLNVTRLAPPSRVPLLFTSPAIVYVSPLPAWKTVPLSICKLPASVQLETGVMPAAWVFATSTEPRESAPLLIVI